MDSTNSFVDDLSLCVDDIAIDVLLCSGVVSVPPRPTEPTRELRCDGYDGFGCGVTDTWPTTIADVFMMIRSTYLCNKCVCSKF